MSAIGCVENFGESLGREISRIVYDESKTFCRLCNLRFDGFIQHESEPSHIAKMSILEYLAEYSLRDDPLLLLSKMKENHLLNPAVIPSLSAVHKSPPALWMQLRSFLNFFRQKKIIRISVFAHGGPLSRTSDFDRLEWIGDLSMRSIYSRVFAHLLKDTPNFAFRQLPFLQFVQSNAVLERLYDQLDLTTLIYGRSRTARNDKTPSSVKIKADVIECVFGEIILGCYQRNANIVALNDQVLGTEGSAVLGKLTLHFLVDLAAAHLMHHFSRFVIDTMSFLTTVRMRYIECCCLSSSPEKYSVSKSVSQIGGSHTRLSPLHTLGSIKESEIPQNYKEPSIKDIMAKLEVLFQHKRYFGNEVHAKISSTNAYHSEFPQIQSLNDFCATGVFTPDHSKLSERFQVYQHLKFLYLSLCKVSRPDDLRLYARKLVQSKAFSHKTFWFGIATHAYLGSFLNCVFFSDQQQSMLKVPVMPSLKNKKSKDSFRNSNNLSTHKECDAKRVPGMLPFLSTFPRVNQMSEYSSVSQHPTTNC